MTLVEVTLVLTVLLGLVSVLLIGFKAYKQGADRAACIQNLSLVQKAVRSYSNLHAKYPGDAVIDLKQQIIGRGKFIDHVAPCPSNGTYFFAGDIVPPVGTLYMTCSISGHVPREASSW